MRRSEAKRYRRHINAILITLADETAVEMTDLFEPWIIGKNYKVGDRVKHNDELYKCIQEHDSQESWTPNLTPALWMVISIEEYPQWILYIKGVKSQPSQFVSDTVWTPNIRTTESDSYKKGHPL